MTRGGTVLALGLLFALGLTPAAAQDGTGAADVFLKQRGDSSYAGEDLLSTDGVGQSRSLIVTDRIVLIIKIQNDDTEAHDFTVSATKGARGFDVRYALGSVDATEALEAAELEFTLGPGRTRRIRAVVDATGAAFGSEYLLSVQASWSPQTRDAARAEITKVSHPG